MGQPHLGLEDLEVYFDVEVYSDGLSVLQGRFEFVLTNGFHCFFVETHTYSADHFDVGRAAFFVDPKIDLDVAGELCFAGFFGKLCLWGVEDGRRANRTADVHGAATSVSSGAGTEAVAVTGTKARSVAVAHGGTAEIGVGGTEVRHLVVSHFQVGLNDDAGFNGELWLDERRSFGWNDLFLYELGEMPLSDRGGTLLTAAAADLVELGGQRWRGWRNLKLREDGLGGSSELNAVLDDERDEKDEQSVDADGSRERGAVHLRGHGIGYVNGRRLKDERRELNGKEDVANTADEGGEDALFLDLSGDVRGFRCDVQGVRGLLQFGLGRRKEGVGHRRRRRVSDAAGVKVLQGIPLAVTFAGGPYDILDAHQGQSVSQVSRSVIFAGAALQ